MKLNISYYLQVDLQISDKLLFFINFSSFNLSADMKNILPSKFSITLRHCKLRRNQMIAYSFLNFFRIFFSGNLIKIIRM